MKQHPELYTTLVDLAKAFDTVSREGLWKIMEKFGCPIKFIVIVYHASWTTVNPPKLPQ